MKKMKDEPTEDQSLTPNAHTGLGDFIAWLQKNIPAREPLALQAAAGHRADFDAVIVKMANLHAIEPLAEKAAGLSFDSSLRSTNVDVSVSEL